jgi:ERCC4-type nuclease
MIVIIKYFKYTDKELDELISSMVILVDTREKKNEHITDYFDRKKITYKKKALDYGDYSFLVPANENLSIPRDLIFSSKVVIERKGSLEEISGNLTNGRDRFEKELCLAPKNKVLLIENGSYADIATGKYNTQYNRKSFLSSLHSFWFKYNVPIMFMPDNKYSGLFIREYFEWYLKNYIR